MDVVLNAYINKFERVARGAFKFLRIYDGTLWLQKWIATIVPCRRNSIIDVWLFVKSVNGSQLLIISAKSSILDVWLGSECASD